MNYILYYIFLPSFLLHTCHYIYILFRGAKEENINERKQLTVTYLKLVDTIKKTTCAKCWGIFVTLFSDIFEQFQYSEANNPRMRCCKLWCKNYNMFVQKNKPCWKS